MISRVAETCFWMHRQIERADAMARLLRVNRSFVLDTALPEERKWYPLLVVSGEHERFDETHSPQARADEVAVQEYLTWNTENPVSVASALYWARENARTIREVISLDMWKVLNDLYLFVRSHAGRRLYESDQDSFYRRITDGAAMFQGVCDNTMLRDSAFDFMRLGMALERAGQTARVVDVHHHTFGASGIDGGGENDAIAQMQWLALLRSCSASAPFTRRTRAIPTQGGVVAFLILDETFPRSVAFCLDEARILLSQLRPQDRAEESYQAVIALEESLKALTPTELEARGVHNEMTRIVKTTSEISVLVHSDYFDTGPRPSTAAQEIGAP